MIDFTNSEFARKEAVERWAAQCNYVLGNNGYIEKAYNSGLITRESDGVVEVVTEAKPIATLLIEAPGNLDDTDNFVRPVE
jgi:hypothetical protein|tara:strand:+ start:1813 stop:2055 length:243 start_codon:yes stop_codon:yes gene_type:complete